MFNHVTKTNVAVIACIGVAAALFSAGCVTEALPLTDGALAELIQSASPSDNSQSGDDSSGRVDDSTPPSSDDFSSDDSPGSQSSDDAPSSADDSVAPSADSSSSSDIPASGPNQRIRADLSGGGLESGHADHRVEDGRRKFSVEVEDFAPGLYAVRINGVEVAMISVGSLGTAEIEFDSKVEVGHTPFPATFPEEVQVGDTVDVGGLVTGAFVPDQ